MRLSVKDCDKTVNNIWYLHLYEVIDKDSSNFHIEDELGNTLKVNKKDLKCSFNGKWLADFSIVDEEKQADALLALLSISKLDNKTYSSKTLLDSL